MKYLLDVDSCAAVVRQASRVHRRFLQNVGNLFVSVVALTELDLWLTRPRTPLRYQQLFIAVMRHVAPLNVDEAVGHRAASIGNVLLGRGRRLTTADLLIAATAELHGLTLVTPSAAVFANVPGLTTVDWLAP